MKYGFGELYLQMWVIFITELYNKRHEKEKTSYWRKRGVFLERRNSAQRHPTDCNGQRGGLSSFTGCYWHPRIIRSYKQI